MLKLSDIAFVYLLCPIMLRHLTKKKSLDQGQDDKIKLHNFFEQIIRQTVSDRAHIVSRGDFCKMTKTNFVYILYLMMPQNFKKILTEGIMKYKAV